MPIYEYECTKCGHVFEELRRMSAREEPATCPECGERAEVRLSTFAAHGESSSSSTGAAPGCACGSGPT